MARDQPTKSVGYFLTQKKILDIVEYAYGFVELGDIQAVGEVLSDLGEQLRGHLEYAKPQNKKDRRKKRSEEKRQRKNSSKPNGLDILAAKHGYDDYKTYLESPHWRDFQKRYAKAWPFCQCITCGSRSYHLHHVNYGRFGNEQLADCLPLCGDCHRKLHESHRREHTQVGQFTKGLMDAFGWGPVEIKKALRGYYAMTESSSAPPASA